MIGGRPKRWSDHEAAFRRGKLRGLRHEGIDPIEARRASKAATAIAGAAAMTFNQCREAYIKAHRAEWRSAVHSQQWEASLDAYAGPIDGLPVQAIDTALVLKVLEPIWATRRGLSSTCCSASQPARTGPCTRRNITAR